MVGAVVDTVAVVGCSEVSQLANVLIVAGVAITGVDNFLHSDLVE